MDNNLRGTWEESINKHRYERSCWGLWNKRAWSERQGRPLWGNGTWINERWELKKKICVTKRPSATRCPLPASRLHYFLPGKLSPDQQPQQWVTGGLATVAQSLMAVFTQSKKRNKHKNKKRNWERIWRDLNSVEKIRLLVISTETHFAQIITLLLPFS